MSRVIEIRKSSRPTSNGDYFSVYIDNEYVFDFKKGVGPTVMALLGTGAAALGDIVYFDGKLYVGSVGDMAEQDLQNTN